MSVSREFVHGDDVLPVSGRRVAEGRYVVQVGTEVLEVEARLLPDGRLRFTLGTETYTAGCASTDRSVQVRLRGRTWRLEPARGRAGAAVAGSGAIEAPMTGTVLDVLVRVGQEVEAGQPLLVLTAMKMEHKLSAGIAGRVVELNATPGDTVDQGTLLVRVEAAGDD